MKLLTEKIASHLKKAFSLDLRALGILRILIASVILIDLGIRATDLEAFYANSGVLPIHALLLHNWNDFHISFHAINGIWQIQALIFTFSAIAALALLVGYRTRLATIVSWIMIISIHNRNPLILQGGDDLLRLTLFWALFLPWGKRYSVDSLNTAAPENNDQRYFSFACLAYIIQVGSVYFFSSLIKTSAEWTSDGTAIYYALSLDQMVWPLGKLIYPYPILLKCLTHTVYYIELFAPFLFLIPVYVRFFRTAGIIIILCLHIGISTTLFVGLFYLIGITTLSGLIPTEVMNWIEKKTISIRSFFLGIFRKMNSLVNKTNKLIISKPENNSLNTIREFAILLALFYCLSWNYGNLSYTTYGVSAGGKWIGHLLRIDQNWGMFSPSVFKDDGWFILEGKTEKDSIIDIFRMGKKVGYEKPESIVSEIKNDRWRKYSENYLFVSNDWMRPFYCNYSMRIWNEAHKDQRIKELNVIYMKEVTAPNYKPVKATREVLCGCR